MYKHILISTDGSQVGQKGVDHGLALAKAVGAKVTIVTVTEGLPAYSGGLGFEYALNDTIITQYETGQAEAAKKVLAAAKQAADGLGVAAETLHVPHAEPASAILEVAKASGCDLIAMASHGRRGLGRLVLGSKTLEVLTHSSIPVLVVR